MSDKDLTLASGATLHISTAPFQDANALVKALARCVKGAPLQDDLLKADLGILKDVLVETVTSPDVERALFKCFERCSYNAAKMIPSNFDQHPLGETFRQDYFEVCWKVIEVNCAPFFVKVFSVLKERLASVSAAPKSS